VIQWIHLVGSLKAGDVLEGADTFAISHYAAQKVLDPTELFKAPLAGDSGTIGISFTAVYLKVIEWSVETSAGRPRRGIFFLFSNYREALPILSFYCRNMHSSTVENYLKTIWGLQQRSPDSPLVPIGRVAQKLSVTPGTATTMMNQLLKQELVDYIPRKGVSLNVAGRKAALQVLRRHRLVESFLVEIMRLDWAEVHEEAEVLEHVISERLLARMDQMLGHPTHDPHGAPIPTSEGEVPSQSTQTLAECSPGDFTLTRVRENRPDFLQWLALLGLKPGTFLRLIVRDSFADTLTLVIAEGPDQVQISLSAAKSLLVVPA
jgi:DtxR family Mn-dependent transcriptional regulator